MINIPEQILIKTAVPKARVILPKDKEFKETEEKIREDFEK